MDEPEPEPERIEGGLALENEHLRLEIELAPLRLHLRAPRYGLSLVGFFPRARLAERARVAGAARFERAERVQTACGPATRVELRDAGDHEDLVLWLEFARDWPGVVLELGIAPQAGRSAVVESLEPLCWEQEGGALALPGAREALRFFRMGYQSWSPAAWLPLDGADARGRMKLFRPIHFGPQSPLPKRGRHVSDLASELRVPGQAGLALGFLTALRWHGQVVLEHRDGAARALRARSATEGWQVEAGDTLRSERLWLGISAPGEESLAGWAERCGRELGAPVPAPVSSGWCSWYHYFTGVRAADVRSNLQALAPFRGQLETVQIDDGFQACVGDWLEPHADFPDGVEPLAREIRAAGFRAGLWLAPFLVSRASRVAQEHPDWLLRDERGRPVLANYNPAWLGRRSWALDLSQREVREWLAHVFAQVRAWGFDYLKLDFLYAGLLRGQRSDARVPPVAAYRATLAELRRAAGPDPFFLGCGAPLGPSVGLFEAMRIGPDVAPAWRAPRLDWLLGLPAAPAAENSIRNVLARAALHQRLWQNDPDCVLVRDSSTELALHEVQTLASVIALSGGLVLASDDVAALAPARAELLRRLLPPLQQPPRTGAERNGVPELLWQPLADGSVLALRVNLAEKPRPLPIDPAALGLDGPLHVWDVWQERYLGVRRGALEGDAVPPHGCRLLRLQPATGAPALLGSTLHVAGGALELAGLESRAGGETRLSLRLPGLRRGRVLVQPHASPPVAAHVEFEGETELALWSRGLEESKGIPDR